MKNIVMCSDGTGNAAFKDRGTNVFKLFESVDVDGHHANRKAVEQIAFYDDGVGTQTFAPLAAFSGAVGWGLSRNVKELYAHLARAYRPGDRIYLSGFSRGAFTVRTLAGFITACGVLDASACPDERALTRAVKRLYAEYRLRYRTAQGRMWAGARRWMVERGARPVTFNNVSIEFIGVWDTVDAVGLPFNELSWIINNFIYRFKFPDGSLNPRVKRACQALSIDDERRTFHPLLWDETKSAKPERIEQIWFPGVHANVGGGYEKQKLSLVALNWMMTRAEAAGLRFIRTERDYYRAAQSAHDHQYDSRAGLANYYRYSPRDITRLCKESGVRPKIHASGIERLAWRTEGYAPGNIPAVLDIVGTGRTPPGAARASALIRKMHGADSSLLERVGLAVKLRELMSYLIVIATIYLVWRAWSPDLVQLLLDLVAGEVTLENAKMLLVLLNPYAWLLLPPVVAYVVGRWLGGWMRRQFSRAWHGVRPALTTLFP